MNAMKKPKRAVEELFKEEMIRAARLLEKANKEKLEKMLGDSAFRNASMLVSQFCESLLYEPINEQR